MRKIIITGLLFLILLTSLSPRIAQADLIDEALEIRRDGLVTTREGITREINQLIAMEARLAAAESVIENYINNNPQASDLTLKREELDHLRATRFELQDYRIKTQDDYRELYTPVKDEKTGKYNATPASTNTGCTKSWFSYDCFQDLILKLGNLLVELFSKILWVVGEAFDYAMTLTVVEFQTYADKPAVTQTWSVVRGIANLFFIFIVLYIGISIILGVGSGNDKSLLVRVIIIALLINFSAFFTRLVIDISNVIANEFYQVIAQGGNISDFFMNNLGLHRRIAEAQVPASGDILAAIVTVFGNVITILVAAFVFGAGALMLVIRAVVLLFLIVFSPLAFLAYAFPKLEGRFDDWLKKLLDQAFFAPLYLLFLMISASIISLGVFTPGAGPLATTFNFAIIIAFMVIALIAAKQLGARGAAGALNLGKKWRTAAVGAAGGWAGRNTIGRAAYGLAESEWIKKRVDAHPRLGGALKSFADTTAKYGFGVKTGFKQKIEEGAKIPDDIKKDPVRLAKYLESLGKPTLNVPIIRSLPGIAATRVDRLIQETAYKKLKPEERAKLAQYQESGTSKIKTKGQIDNEITKLNTDNVDISNWFKLAPEEIRSRPGNADKLTKYNKYQTELEKLRATKETAFETEEQADQARQKISKVSGVLERLEKGVSDKEKKDLEAARAKVQNTERREKILTAAREQMTEMEKTPGYEKNPEYIRLAELVDRILRGKEPPKDTKPEGDKDTK